MIDPARFYACEFCSITKGNADGQEYERKEDGTERIFQVHYREAYWEGIPVYVKYMKEVTEEVKIRKEKERLYEEDVLNRLEREPSGYDFVVGYNTGGSIWTRTTAQSAWSVQM